MSRTSLLIEKVKSFVTNWFDSTYVFYASYQLNASIKRINAVRDEKEQVKCDRWKNSGFELKLSRIYAEKISRYFICSSASTCCSFSINVEFTIASYLTTTNPKLKDVTKNVRIDPINPSHPRNFAPDSREKQKRNLSTVGTLKGILGFLRFTFDYKLKNRKYFQLDLLSILRVSVLGQGW